MFPVCVIHKRSEAFVHVEYFCVDFEDLNMKKVQRVETERDPPVGVFPRPPDGGDSSE